VTRVSLIVEYIEDIIEVIGILDMIIEVFDAEVEIL
jgi:hypothetical protein